MKFPASSIVWFPQVLLARVEDGFSSRQRGWVTYQGSYWSAQFYPTEEALTAQPGDRVQVLGRVSNTLVVLPKHYHLILQSEAEPATQSSLFHLFGFEKRKRDHIANARAVG